MLGLDYPPTLVDSELYCEWNLKLALSRQAQSFTERLVSVGGRCSSPFPAQGSPFVAQEGKLKKLDSSLPSVDRFPIRSWIGMMQKPDLYGLLEEINSLGQLHLHFGKQSPNLLRLFLQKEPSALEVFAVFPNTLLILAMN